MKAASIRLNGTETAALESEAGFVPIGTVNERLGGEWSTTVEEWLQRGEWDRLRAWYEGGGFRRLAELPAIPIEEADLAPLVRRPRKIIGVGMNYREKLEELRGNREGADPVLFAKPDTSLIGPGDPIRLPHQSSRVTAEAELAVVIGAACKDADEEGAERAIAGYAASLDMTAADILADNPRYMYSAKSFDTFCGLGSQLVTPDEAPAPEKLFVETWLNGAIAHRNSVSKMLYPPSYIVSFVSQVMTLLPGDVILTGTPGSVPISRGDTVECRIVGLRSLSNPVL